ncbi:MAG TPA: hypothetical protein VHJ82_04230 [Actinomycetota bacterium]|nr:hypothetical protein [Actinomycetota bacterium]
MTTLKNEVELDLLRTHNPIPEQDDSGWGESAAGRSLFARIEAASVRARPTNKRSRWRRPTLVPIFVVLSAGALLFASAIAGDRTIVVKASDALEDPSAVERYLAEEGIEAKINIVPTKPDLVGKWFHLFLDPNAEVDEETFALLKSYVGEIDFRYEKVAERCGDGSGCPRTGLLELPGSVKGPITLVVGREAEAGEEYWATNMEWGNELAPSGAFYCMGLEDKTPAQIEQELESNGYQVEWTYDPKHTGIDGEESRRVTQPPARTELTVAYIFRPGIVSLRVSPPEDADRSRRSAGTPTSETGRPDFGTC